MECFQNSRFSKEKTFFEANITINIKSSFLWIISRALACKNIVSPKLLLSVHCTDKSNLCAVCSVQLKYKTGLDRLGKPLLSSTKPVCIHSFCPCFKGRFHSKMKIYGNVELCLQKLPITLILLKNVSISSGRVSGNF